MKALDIHSGTLADPFILVYQPDLMDMNHFIWYLLIFEVRNVACARACACISGLKDIDLLTVGPSILSSECILRAIQLATPKAQVTVSAGSSKDTRVCHRVQPVVAYVCPEPSNVPIHACQKCGGITQGSASTFPSELLILH